MDVSSVPVVRVPAPVSFALRQRVLRPHQTLAEMALPGDDDPDTATFAALGPGGTVLATASVRREPPPWRPGAEDGWRLRGMATEPEVRGRGLGGRLLDAIVGHVAAHGGGELWCNARLPARGLYRRGGFREIGEQFEEPHIGPHVAMARKVAALPSLPR